MVCPQCKAITEAGTRCKRHTCVRYPYCYQHLRLIDGLELKDSEIPNSGTGVFATKDFPLKQKDKGSKKKKKGGRVAMVGRWLLLWSPFGKKAVSASIIRHDGECVSDPHGKAEALTAHRGEVFKRRSIDSADGSLFLANHAKVLDISSIRMPSEASFLGCLKRVSHSAPGPDGIPYGCWKGVAAVAAKLRVRRDLANMSDVAKVARQ